MALTCDHCHGEISEAPLIVPAMPSGNAHYHARRDCARAAQVRTGHTWSARCRARKIREATHGPGGSVS